MEQPQAAIQDRPSDDAELARLLEECSRLAKRLADCQAKASTLIHQTRTPRPPTSESAKEERSQSHSTPKPAIKSAEPDWLTVYHLAGDF